MSKPPSRLRRLARLGSLTSRVTGSYLGERVKSAIRGDSDPKAALERLHLDNAERLVATLASLRGAAQKVGQSMALAAGSLDLPADVRRSLDRLNDQGEPVPFDEIRATVERELGGRLEELFADFDPAPLGIASLAQAHAARLHDGTEVVIKVLHDGVSDSVDTDLLALKTMLIGGRVLRRDRDEIEEAFAEIRERLAEELDYLQEAANIQVFTELYGSDPRVRIPRLHPAYCTERVLTLDRLSGRPLEAFLEDATPQARQRAGLTLGQLYYEMVFKHRTLHADPHPGNYLFEDDGRVGLLDFGCVKRFDEFWLSNYARAALGGLEGDRDATLEACRAMGAWVGDSPDAADMLWSFADTLAQPYRSGLYTIGGQQDSTLDKLRPVMHRFVRYPEVRLPRHVIYMHRSLGGLYSIARRLVVTADWGALLREHATAAIEQAEGRG